jgi:fructose-1,6-bisphosphatase/inositol monophosphatase family enzyme
MKKFTFWRNAIVSELYVVDAATEEAAREMLQAGEVEVFNEEWMDWATDDFELEHVEIIDPLYRMVKDYESVDKLVE